MLLKTLVGHTWNGCSWTRRRRWRFSCLRFLNRGCHCVWGKTSHDKVIMGGMIIIVVLDLGGAPLVKLMHLFLKCIHITYLMHEPISPELHIAKCEFFSSLQIFYRCTCFVLTYLHAVIQIAICSRTVQMQLLMHTFLKQFS